MGIALTTQTLMAQVPSYVPTNGLVGYWPFNGNANDQSINALNGTVTGATLTNDRNGNANGAYLFNSTVASNISIQTQPVTGTGLQNQFSIVMWVKSTRVANFVSESGLCPGSVSVPMANSNQNWAFVPGNSGTNLGVGFSIGTNGIMVAEHANNILVSRLSNSSTYNDFVNVAIIYDTNNTYLYVNGVLVRTRPMYCASNIKRIPSLITLGTSLYSPNFSGIIDDLGVWNRALTASEIQLLYTGCSTASPTGNTTQTLCSGSTVANLTATGTNIKWYSTSTGGTALASTTDLVNGTTYYASQTVNGCESTIRLAVIVILNNPTVTTSATTVCSGQPTTLTASSGASTTSNFSVGSIGPSGGYVFYDQGSVINGWRYLEASPNDNGSDSGTGCYCTSIPNTSNLIGTGQTNTSNWISAGCNGNWFGLTQTLAINGLINWFIPSKDELNIMYTNLKINNLGNFQNVPYWSSSPAGYGSCGINGGAWVQNFTNGTQYSDYRPGYQGSGNLRLVRQFVSGTPFSTYLWSTGATTASISVNPTATTQYWVDVITNGVTCRKFITITVNSTTLAPTGSTSQTFCSGSTVANLTAAGTNIKWYSTSIGGTALASTTALVSGTTYYASQTVNGCESTTRLAVFVSLNNPTVSASVTTVCSGQPTTLTASSGASATSNFSVGSIGPSGGYVFYDKGSVTNGWRYLEAAPSNIQNSSWGCGDVNIAGATSLSIGSGLTNTNAIVTTCTTPSIAAKRCLDHSVNGCDDWYLPSQNEFAQIYQNLIVNNLGNFNVGPIPTLGTLYWTSSQLTAASGSHCCLECSGNFYQYSKIYELYVRPVRQFASGTPFSSYLWSTGATTASISVNPTSTTQYWVDVTSNGVTCRKFITITINSTTAAPTGNTSQTLCSGSTVANLTATGANIKWYSTTTGGTALASTTQLVNGTTYYASQTVNGCESTTRLAVVVSLNTAAGISLISGNSNQDVYEGCQIQEIIYTLSGGATGVTTLGLPYWVNVTTVGNTVTISSNGMVGPGQLGYYNFTITTIGGCGTSSVIGLISVMPVFPPFLNSPIGTDNQSVCLGASIQNISYISNGEVFYNVQNLPLGVTYSFNGGQILITGTPSEAGVFNYTVFGQPIIGPMCTNVFTTQGTITVTAAPSGTNNSITFCFDSSPQDLFALLGPNAQTGGVWTPTLVSGTGVFDPAVDISGNYTYTSFIPCPSFSVVTAFVNPAPPAPIGANNQIMAQGATIANLTLTGLTGAEILWYSSPIGGTPLLANTPLVNGTTYYASQTTNGCESQDRLPVIVQVTLSNNEFGSIGIVYSPNPVIDILTIKASIELKNAKICNLLGQTIFQQRFNSNEIELNMSDLPTGTYFVIVESDDRKETFKVIKK